MSLRAVRNFIFNSVLATIGVAIMEGAVYPLVNPKTYAGRYLKELLISAAIAFLLGYLAYFKWRSATAFWVWIIAIVTFGWRLTIGSGNADDLAEVVTSATLAFVSVRAVFYSLGAICCSLITARPISSDTR
jgi:hypothetical protein